MSAQISRHQFVAGLLTAAAALTLAASSAIAAHPAQEYYEIRIYQCQSAENQKVVVSFVEDALLPALNRQKIDRVGIFTPTGEKADHSVYVLIPYPTLDALGGLNAALAADATYSKDAAEYFAIEKKAAPYSRIESRLMKAFAGMPVIEQQGYSQEKKPRLFELRTYESHNAHMAQLKVEMFNKGEIDIMREVGLGPVFFGETLISNDVPNLTYMLSAENEEAHQTHWKGFGPHPEWQKLKKVQRYKGTVSKIISTMLAPTEGSQL